MVLRVGYKQGPARPWDVAAAVSGVALVVLLVVFVAVAGTRPHYSHIRDTISALGAEDAPGRWWFAAVNFAGAALIAVFAYGVQRRLAVGLATVGFLWATGLGALLVGSFPCTEPCRVGTTDAHGDSAIFAAVMILLFMLSAAWALRRRPTTPLAVTTFVLAPANFVLLVLLALAGHRNWADAGLLERLFWATAYLWVLAASAAIAAATRARHRPARFDPRLVQPKLLRSARSWGCAAYLTAAVADPDEARTWLRAMTDPTTGLIRPHGGRRPAGSVTLAFSAAGLGHLGVSPSSGPSGPDLQPFVQDMAGRAGQLGDRGPSAPTQWQEPWRSGRTDVLVWAEAVDTAAVARLVAAARAMPGSAGLDFHSPVQYASAGAHGDGPGHGPLRFRDGISQPWLPLSYRDGPDREPGPDLDRAAGGTLDPFGDWRPLAVGEFVLGEVDESGDVSPVPDPKEIFHHGSFVVVRKLAQNFDALSRLDGEMRARITPESPPGPDFAERMMGRRFDGQPLMTPADGINGFTYGTDPDGLSCQLGAHARRANPRDALGFGTMIPDRHRIIRRGKPYADDPDAPEGWKDGLVFVAVNARLDDQFEFIQTLWLNDGARQRVGATRDLFAGASGPAGAAGVADCPIVLQAGPGPVATGRLPETVRTMGGGYFFAPSMAGLRALASPGGGAGQERSGVEHAEQRAGVDPGAGAARPHEFNEAAVAPEGGQDGPERLVRAVDELP
jgi:Dyp-type peroxidase family